MKPIFEALRPHQWTKNLLLFVPLVTAHAWGDTGLIRAAFLGFAAFCLTASAVYLVNDLLDLEADRKHPTKRLRPLASGALKPSSAVAVAVLLLLAGLSLSYFLGGRFLGIISLYLVVTSAYSLLFKKSLLLDVVLLSSLYTLRILAGGMATSIELSEWLLVFSLFAFFSLALVKRYSELRELVRTSQEDAPGRAYMAQDLVPLLALGVSSAAVSALVLAFYVTGDRVRSLYSRPEFLWLVVPLVLYWLGRAWILANRGLVHEDPVVFALKDRASYIVAATLLAVMWIAI